MNSTKKPIFLTQEARIKLGEIRDSLAITLNLPNLSLTDAISKLIMDTQIKGSPADPKEREVNND